VRELNRFLKAEADSKGHIDLIHGTVVELAHFFLQTCFVKGAHLFQQDNGILCQTALVGLELDMGWQPVFFPLACDSGGDYGGAVLISNIILYNQNRPYPALFGADYGTQVRIEDVPSTNIHIFHSYICVWFAQLLCYYFGPFGL